MSAEWTAAIAAAVAVIASLLTYILSSRITKGQVELQIRELISAARRHHNEMLVESCNANDEIKKIVLDAAWEDILNAYDEACKKYLDKKVDQKSFKQMYQDEIRKIVEDKEFQEKHSTPQSRYRFILKVYGEWRS